MYATCLVHVSYLSTAARTVSEKKSQPKPPPDVKVRISLVNQAPLCAFFCVRMHVEENWFGLGKDLAVAKCKER